MRMVLIKAGVGCALALAVLAGCGGGDDGSKSAVQVVATTPQVADMARAVAGRRAEVTQILRPGVDAHDFEPRPSDARAVAEGDVLVASGGELDDWVDEISSTAGLRRRAPDGVRRDRAGEPGRPALVAGPPQRRPRGGGDRARPDRHRSEGPRDLRAKRALLHRAAAPYGPLDRRVRGQGASRAAQAGHHARRLRLLRPPLRHRGGGRPDPLALDPGPALRRATSSAWWTRSAPSA